jgi:hypothetical protein
MKGPGQLRQQRLRCMKVKKCAKSGQHDGNSPPPVASGMSHADDRLTALKGTGFSPYIKPAKSRGL